MTRFDPTWSLEQTAHTLGKMVEDPELVQAPIRELLERIARVQECQQQLDAISAKLFPAASKLMHDDDEAHGDYLAHRIWTKSTSWQTVECRRSVIDEVVKRASVSKLTAEVDPAAERTARYTCELLTSVYRGTPTVGGLERLGLKVETYRRVEPAGVRIKVEPLHRGPDGERS